MKNPRSKGVPTHRQNSIRNSGLILLALGTLFAGAASHAASFAYADFRAPSYLIFQGDATLFQQRVRLAPAERGKAGGLWFQGKLFVKDGFETTFQFQLTDRGGFGANGLALVIQNNETPRLGAGGHGIGFRGIPNALAVKFDPYHYQDQQYLKYDEVAVLVRISSDIYSANANIMGSVTNALYSDGQVHSVKIKYQPGNLDVYLDDLTKPLLTVPLNLADSVALENGRAWVGLTAATGADYFNHDLISWSFNSPDSVTELLPRAPAAKLEPDHTPAGSNQYHLCGEPEPHAST